MGKPMGRHPLTHYINPKIPFYGSTSLQNKRYPVISPLPRRSIFDQPVKVPKVVKHDQCLLKTYPRANIQADTLIWDLSYWIPIFSLIKVIPFILNIFFFSGPEPFSASLIFQLFHCIPLLALIFVVTISYKSFFCGPTHPIFLTLTSPLQMANTRNQYMEASVNHVTFEIASTNSLLAKLEFQVEHKFDTMETNFMNHFNIL
jgi:hypothetical protein